MWRIYFVLIFAGILISSCLVTNLIFSAIPWFRKHRNVPSMLIVNLVFTVVFFETINAPEILAMISVLYSPDLAWGFQFVCKMLEDNLASISFLAIAVNSGLVALQQNFNRVKRTFQNTILLIWLLSLLKTFYEYKTTYGLN